MGMWMDGMSWKGVCEVGALSFAVKECESRGLAHGVTR